MKNNKEKIIKDIKSLYGAGLKLSTQEVERIFAVAQETGLSIVLKEIEPYRDDSGNLLIFIKRDGYRKAAQRDKEYEYHEVFSYCKNDIVEIKEGKLNFSPNLIDRGEVLGGICVVKRKSASREMITLVDIKEYLPKNNGAKTMTLREKLWDEKKQIMIEKVAEVVGLRRAFSNMFNGIYHEAELDSFVSTKDIAIPNKEDIDNAFEKRVKNKKNGNEEKEEIKDLQNSKDEMEAKILGITLEEYLKRKNNNNSLKNEKKGDILTQKMFEDIEGK